MMERQNGIMLEMSEEDKQMLEWLSGASSEDVVTQMDNVEKELFGGVLE